MKGDQVLHPHLVPSSDVTPTEPWSLRRTKCIDRSGVLASCLESCLLAQSGFSPDLVLKVRHCLPKLPETLFSWLAGVESCVHHDSEEVVRDAATFLRPLG